LSKKSAAASAAHDDAASDDGSDESDAGPYCICRKGDDHTFMIACEVCEDWFHLKCVNIPEDWARNLLTKFYCPNCQTDVLRPTFRLHCRLDGCYLPARLIAKGSPDNSNYCSDEHLKIFWKSIIDKVPDTDVPSLGGVLTKREIATVLAWSTDAAAFKALGKAPDIEVGPTFDWDTILNDDEKTRLADLEKERAALLHNRSIWKNIELFVQLAIKQGKTIAESMNEKSICGFCDLLVKNEAQYEIFFNSPEGLKALDDGKIEDTSCFCTKVKCKHLAQGWKKNEIDAYRGNLTFVAEELGKLYKKELDWRRFARQRAGMEANRA
jgi:COMPASS component SPP1